MVPESLIDDLREDHLQQSQPQYSVGDYTGEELIGFTTDSPNDIAPGIEGGYTS